MSIYKSNKGKETILSLYDSQLSRLKTPWKDVYVDTTFGKTHIIETGNLSGEPLLFFHGGNSTSAYTLLTLDFIMDDFHIYAVDTIGHPGKSAETSLSPKNYDYGKWVAEIIEKLGYEKISCFGGSFGAGIIAKTMCMVPDKIKKAVIYVPSGIKNAPALNNSKMMFPMIMYWITGKDNWLKSVFLPLAITEDNITEDIYETAKLSILHSKVKVGMPSDVDENLMKKCNVPTLVMAAEKDCLFPGKGVIERAERIIPNCKTYLLEGRGHMHFLTADEKKMIVDFLI